MFISFKIFNFLTSNILIKAYIQKSCNKQAVNHICYISLVGSYYVKA